MQIPIIIAALFLGQIAVASANPISNPMRDFLLNFDVQDPKDVIKTEPDLNADGVPEILLTYNNTVNGRQGNIWVLYRSLPGGGYERIDELTTGAPIEFHQKASAIKKRNGGADIVRYSPGGSGRGVISSFNLGTEGVGETVIREISAAGSDAAIYQSMFNNPETKLVFVAEDAKKLRWKHLPLREWLRGMTILKWCLYIVGLLVALVFLLLMLRGLLGMVRSVKS
tara:strand:+ start:2044 stop:2721 length:678 start_codon:yes stop_codon:yes gene_type:complete